MSEDKRRACCQIRQQDQYPHREFEAGVIACGDEIAWRAAPRDPGDVYVTWNAYGARAKAGWDWAFKGGLWMVVENGYFRQDGKGRRLYAFGQNGHNGSGIAPPIDDDGGKRWRNFDLTVEGEKSGDYILVLGQRGGTYSPMSMRVEWPEEIVGRLLKATDRKIRYRPHPERPRAVRLPESPRVAVADHAIPLEDQIRKAHAVVVWTSSGALEAIRLGVPAFFEGPHHVASSMMQRNVEDIEKPRRHLDRVTFFNRLAWHMFSTGEIAAGLPWRRMAHGAS